MNRQPDDDMPAGFRDADIELAGLEALGRKSSALRRQGICTHGWLQGREGCETKCLHCGEVFATLELAREIGRELLNG